MVCDQFAKYVDAECDCDVHKSPTYKSLSILLLDCWQREYDKRPYTNFQINKLFFEKRMKRVFVESDWFVLIEYLEKRKPNSVKITNIEIPDFKNNILIERLIRGLDNAENVQFKNVALSVSVLLKLRKNIASSKIKSLDLSQNELTLEHLGVLRCILIQSDILESLNVENCLINENTFAVLADGIHKSRSIRSVNISRHCPMSLVSIFDNSKYINLVAQLLWQNKLTYLSLRQSNINGYDLETLTEYLSSTSSKLLHLDLQGNNLTSHGTELLFTALTKTKNLRKLNLSANNVGSRGGMVIARLISYTHLESLDITHNQIGYDVMYELLSELKKPCVLKELKIYGNKFNIESAAVLKRLLRATVFDQNNIDVIYTWDHSKDELCVVPYFNSGRIHN